MTWKLRKVTLEDSEKLFQWRNSPEVYRYLFNAAPIERNQHEQWMIKILNNPKIAFYIANFNQDDVGTVRYDFNDEKTIAEIGIYLAPEFQGKGMGASMLNAAEYLVKQEYKTLKKILAKVLVENIASEKMFLSTGFKKSFIQLEKEV